MAKSRGFPLDLINETLLRLPSSSLARFRCVSRRWSSLISNPLFLRKHHDRSRDKPLLLVAEIHGGNPYTLRLSTLSGEGDILKYFSMTVPEYVKMEHSSGDVICLTNNSSVFLCNPATGELVALPASRRNAYHRFGFGYVPSLGQFKVARFDYGLSCDVFTVGTDRSWRAAGHPPCRVDGGRGMPFLNGALHLLPARAGPADQPVSVEFLLDDNGTAQYVDELVRAVLFVGDGIAAFDLELEAWRTVPLPSFDCDEMIELGRGWEMFLRELKGLLCLGVSLPHKLDLRLLKDYESGRWVKEYSISFSLLPRACRWPQAAPVAIMDDGRILMDCSELGLLFYDRREERFTEIEGSRECSASLYVENILLSLRKPSTI
ncbi:putative F-box protein At3g10240 [Phoenix dactylifera]|uniref:F-box protein At3g10240 n=1 Tax=Phoenix dactylifera TaxID=42345 RepID=A0A8B7BN99_PHODC|nr:putative F-box protein At3g10240 [Phoenix dactylifera]